MLRLTMGLVSGGLAFALVAAAQSDPVGGRKIFESQCALCHGQSGGGGRGPALTRPKLAKAPDDAALRRVISDGIPPEMPAAWQLNPQEVSNVAAYVLSLGSLPSESLPGDRERGERVYDTQGCAACHMVAGKGEGFGPELTDIGARRNAAHLRRAILQPSSALPPDFVYLAVTPASGEPVRGIRLNEDTFTIQLKDARGLLHSYRKSEIKELRRLDKETPMPSYGGRIPPADLDDLLAYLAGLKGKL
jgi:putative heme-binding domain-containing protein